MGSLIHPLQGGTGLTGGRCQILSPVALGLALCRAFWGKGPSCGCLRGPWASEKCLTTPNPCPGHFASILTPGSGYPHPPDSTPSSPGLSTPHSPWDLKYRGAWLKCPFPKPSL